MPDIIERLRDRDAVVMSGLFHAIPVMTEAANEIERLRTVLEKIAETYAVSTFAGQQARAALNQQLEQPYRKQHGDDQKRRSS